MTILTSGRINQVNGPPDGGGVYPSVSIPWRNDGSDFFTNGVVSFPKVAGTLNDLVTQNAAGQHGYVARNGIDGTAIHDNVASEISAITVKGSPVGADFILIEDSAAANIKKHVLISSLPFAATSHTHLEADITDLDHTDADAIHDNVASEISAITVKGSPVGADFLVIEDSEAANVKKHILISSLPVVNPGGSDSQFQYNNGSVFGGVGAMTFNDSTGAITMNAGEVVGGDVIVKTQSGVGDGTAFQVDVSTGRVGVGDGGTLGNPFNVNFFTSSVNNSPNLISIKNITTGDMEDPFGVGIVFKIQDVSAVSNNIGILKFVRDSADNEGKFVLQVGTDGVEDSFTVDHLSKTVFNVSELSGGDFEIRSQSGVGSGTVFYANASTENVSIGGAVSNKASQSGTILTIDSTGISRIELTSSVASSDNAPIGIIHVHSTNVSGNNGVFANFQWRLDGVSAANRGGKMLFRTKIDGGATTGDHLVINNTGKVTINGSALVGADFDVLSEDSLSSVSSLLIDVSDASSNFTPLTKFDGRIFRESAEIQTTDATVTILNTFTLEDENVYHVKVKATAVESDGSNRASYERIVTVYRTGAGSATIQGAISTVHEVESDAAWDLTFNVNGNNLRVIITGVAATTIEWGCQLEIENISET